MKQVQRMETQTSMLSHRPAEGMPESVGHHGWTKANQDGISGQRAKKGDVTEVSRDTGMGWPWVPTVGLPSRPGSSCFFPVKLKAFSSCKGHPSPPQCAQSPAR